MRLEFLFLREIVCCAISCSGVSKPGSPCVQLFTTSSVCEWSVCEVCLSKLVCVCVCVCVCECVCVCVCVCPSVGLSAAALAASASVYTCNQRYSRVSFRHFDSWIFEKGYGVDKPICNQIDRALCAPYVSIFRTNKTT